MSVVTDPLSAPPSSSLSPSHPPPEWVVTQTLDRIAGMQRFNRWLFEEIRPYLGRRVLEVGSGIGNFSPFFASRLGEESDLLVLSDVSADYVALLKQQFGGTEGVVVEECRMEAPPTERLSELGIDTVVALNVLEHVADDRLALRMAAEILRPRGRLILLVPAWPKLYCQFDRFLGHHRRYNKKDLAEKLKDSGLDARITRHFNFLGAFGWFFSGKIIRRKVLPKGQLRLYDLAVPILRRVERWTGPPFGLSILMVAEKSAITHEKAD